MSAQTDSVGTAAVAAGVWTIANVTTCVAFGATPLVAVTVAPYDPAAVGVPLMTPPALNDKPGGRLPALTANVGAGPAAVVYVKLYGVPTLPSGGGPLVIVGGSCVCAAPASRQVAEPETRVRGKPR